MKRFFGIVMIITFLSSFYYSLSITFGHFNTNPSHSIDGCTAESWFCSCSQKASACPPGTMPECYVTIFGCYCSCVLIPSGGGNPVLDLTKVEYFEMPTSIIQEQDELIANYSDYLINNNYQQLANYLQNSKAAILQQNRTEFIIAEKNYLDEFESLSESEQTIINEWLFNYYANH